MNEELKEGNLINMISLTFFKKYCIVQCKFQ